MSGRVIPGQEFLSRRIHSILNAPPSDGSGIALESCMDDYIETLAETMTEEEARKLLTECNAALAAAQAKADRILGVDGSPRPV